MAGMESEQLPSSIEEVEAVSDYPFCEGRDWNALLPNFAAHSLFRVAFWHVMTI